MSAFALDYSGDPVPCDFRGCVLEAWHDGDHQLAKPKPKFSRDRIHTCKACGANFVIYGEDREPSPLSDRETCGKQECVLALAKLEARFSEAPLMCRCPQRSYPHELSIHSEIRFEWWAHKQNLCWPWSLMASKREEPSTERKAEK